MAKQIVFCADGTWKGPPDDGGYGVVDRSDEQREADSEVSNVVKLFGNLAGRVSADSVRLTNEQERVLVDASGKPIQVAKYMHGVGDSTNVLNKVFGGVFGVGVIGRIVRGYTFISRYYEPGDSIHVTGFSRGAYTARSLASMIANVGLLNRDTYDVNDRKQAYRLGIAAWCKGKDLSLTGSGLLTDLANSVLGFLGHVVALQIPKNGLVPNVPIKSVGVWDTVGSLGVPLYVKDRRFDLFRFTDSALSRSVERGFHAMSIDELRADFPVTRWAPRDGVSEVWFAGAHSDVGGGYPDAGLSDIALDWMMRQLSGVGVRLASPLTQVPDITRGSQRIHKPWDELPFNLLLQSSRSVGPKDVIHQSVATRWAADASYRPSSMKPFADGGVGSLQIAT